MEEESCLEDGSAGVGVSAIPTLSADGFHGCLDGGGLIRSLARHTMERRGASHTMEDTG